MQKASEALCGQVGYSMEKNQEMIPPLEFNMLSHRICHDYVLLLKLQNLDELVLEANETSHVSRVTKRHLSNPVEKQNRKPPEAPKVDSKARIFNWMKGFRAPTKSYSSFKESMFRNRLKRCETWISIDTG